MERHFDWLNLAIKNLVNSHAVNAIESACQVPLCCREFILVAFDKLLWFVSDFLQDSDIIKG